MQLPSSICSSSIMVLSLSGAYPRLPPTARGLPDIIKNISCFAKVIFFLFFQQINRKMIYKIPISFTILYFQREFKQHFEIVVLPQKIPGRKESQSFFPAKCYFLPQMTIFVEPNRRFQAWSSIASGTSRHSPVPTL
ncbi:MAG TPA: hypothetical protein H9969_01130 [Candidatus Barnesiella merdipullorum]|nr:hypothetical protein B5G10_07540 [Barnesiella sp. An55]HIZ25660.1 hypothetical protein [Candidatus Barnesiella merdipullorum]